MHENTICTNTNDMRIYARHKLVINKEHPDVTMKGTGQANRKGNEGMHYQVWRADG